MARNRAADALLLVLLVALLLAGTWYLMAMRFRSGDIYPPYSSLRADPLGSKAFYDALKHMDPYSVRRHYANIEDLRTGTGDTVMILGARNAGLYAMRKDLTRLAADGARVVVAFNEHRRKGPETDEEEPADNTAVEEPAEPNPGEDEETEDWKPGSWDLTMGVSDAAADDTGKYQAFRVNESGNLPEQISVTSPVFFDDRDEKWLQIYAFENDPVIVERVIGQGSVVLLSDSYPLSNEALRWELYPRLVSWLLGGKGNVVFVESHLGVRESQGVMTLVRKYRLTMLLLCFGVVALLAVWKNAVPLAKVPEGAARDGTHVISEKDQFMGFVSLLGRNIGAGDVIRVCIQEARKGYRGRSARRGSSEELMTEVSGIARGEKDPVKAYNQITERLSERTRR